MNIETRTDNMEVNYGYGEAGPDTATKKKYGYVDVDYGYGVAAPDLVVPMDYGYGDAAPDLAKEKNKSYGYEDMDSVEKKNSCEPEQRSPERRVHRRSSMKQGVSRRASVGYTGEIEVNLPGKREPVRRRTSIAFHDNNEVKEVEPVASLTDQPAELWFQQEEYALIREKACLLTELASSRGGQQVISQKRLCTRGLESHIDSENVYEEQYVAWKSVFLEQYHQRNMGEFNDETVSKIYQMAATESQSRAQQRARQDTNDIENYTRSTRMMMRRCSM